MAFDIPHTQLYPSTSFQLSFDMHLAGTLWLSFCSCCSSFVFSHFLPFCRFSRRSHWSIPPRLQGHQLRGIRGFFSRSSKSSVEANSPAALKTRSISDHLLRRTASAPAKGRKKTKLALTESMASISDPRPSPDRPVGPAGESVQGPEGAMEKRPQLRPSLTHRPISMPLDRLLEGQLSLCSSEKGRHHLGADAVIGGCYVLIAGCTSLHLEIVCYYYTILLIVILYLLCTGKGLI